VSITTSDVAALAASVEAKPSKLLTLSNPKTAKGEALGYLTAILHLAPHRASGANLCSGATAGCIAACLNTAGRGGFDTRIQAARIRKSKWFRADRQAFMLRLEREIRAHVANAARHGLTPAVRLNGTSDVPWESVRYTRADGTVGTVIDVFPDVQFYDYTKVALRFTRPLPANYDLTFSAADGNERAVELAQKHGARVAVVFRNKRKPGAEARRWNLPKSYRKRKLVDADRHDLRFLDPAGVVCGLKAKGAARFDTTGFVRDIVPARV
jgi:hypothetical protein